MQLNGDRRLSGARCTVEDDHRIAHTNDRSPGRSAPYGNCFPAGATRDGDDEQPDACHREVPASVSSTGRRDRSTVFASRSSTGNCVSIVAPTSPPGPGPPETPRDPSASSVSRTRRMAGLGDVHDHPRSGSLELGHIRNLERLALWSTPPTRWPSTGICVPADEYASFTKKYGLHHERITLSTTFNTK